MKVLIVGAQPYRPSGNSRALLTYLSGFSSTELAQVFSDRRTPIQGMCDRLFQITDRRLVERRFKKVQDTLFHKENLPKEDRQDQIAYRPPIRKKTPLYRLLRKAVWKKKYWDTAELETFVDGFSPDVIFVVWGPDFWQMDIAIHLSKSRKAPVVLCILDDCRFNLPAKGPFAKTYSRKFIEAFDALLEQTEGSVYISDKLKNAYLERLGLPGIHVPVSSPRPVAKPFPPDLSHGDFLYCGNLGEGRKETLVAFAEALSRAKKTQKVIVYSAESPQVESTWPNIEFHPPVLYDRLPELEAKACALISCEGFSRENIDKVRYSLSTKVGDCLRSGKVLLSLGPTGAGSVDYLKEKDAALFCTSLDAMDQFIEDMYAKTEEELLALVQRELQAGNEFDLKTNAEKVRDYLLGLVRKSGE